VNWELARNALVTASSAKHQILPRVDHHPKVGSVIFKHPRHVGEGPRRGLSLGLSVDFIPARVANRPPCLVRLFALKFCDFCRSSAKAPHHVPNFRAAVVGAASSGKFTSSPENMSPKGKLYNPTFSHPRAVLLFHLALCGASTRFIVAYTLN
jgi:hypothetical protein